MSTLTNESPSKPAFGTGSSDYLSDMISELNLRTLVWCRNEFRAPWGLRHPGSLLEIPAAHRPGSTRTDFPSHIKNLKPLPPQGGFYIITEGSCLLQLDAVTEPIVLGQGDLVVLLSRGHGHILRDDLQSPVKPIWELWETIPLPEPHLFRTGGNGSLTRLISGVFLFEPAMEDHLLAALPPIIHLQSQNGQTAPWLSGIVQLMTQESASYQTGTRAVLAMFANILLAHAIRNYVQSMSSQNHNWLRAFMDPEIGRVLAFIHRHPEADWTVESMAEFVAMSRSAFATRFTTAVGDSPRQYVTTCRMHKARELLRRAHLSIKEVARSVGYESEAAFSVAFKRFSGVAPIVFKKSPSIGRLPTLTTHPDFALHAHYFKE